jgi:hypothetical protein
MKRNSGLQAPWVWPVEAAHYDRTPQLKPCEVEALRVNIPLLQEGALPWEVIEKCKVPRLLDPLEAVCDHVGLQQKYRSNLKIRMLCDMAGRERSFWGWTEEEWIESIKNGDTKSPQLRRRHICYASSTLFTSWDGVIFYFTALGAESLVVNGLPLCSAK